MEPNLLKYIWRYSSGQQIKLILVTVLSFPILYASLELPKMIVNDGIIASEEPKSWFGMDFGAIEYVLVLCLIYLCLVLGNGWFKMRINTFRGVVGERMLRRLRFGLIDRALRFPLPQYSRVSAGEIISTVTAETEPLAGFIGDSFALPAFQGGTMLTILAFMFIQDPILGLASVSMIPLQVYIIPKLQKRVNALKKERVRRVGKLSEQLNEAINAAQEIRLQGTHRYHMADFSMHLGGIFLTRMQLFHAKFFMKFINNLLNQLTPILFFSIGGVLAIRGNIDVGILTAALTAYKDMTAPWKELLNFYQTYQDSLIKYEQIREGFEPEGLQAYDHISNDDDLPQQLDGSITVKSLTVLNETGDRAINNLSLDVKPGQTVLIDSKDSGGMKRLAQALRGLTPIDGGSVQYGDYPLAGIPYVTLGRRVALVGPEPVMFAGSFMQNLHYGMRHSPRPDTDETLTDDRRIEIEEAALSGNMSDRMDEIWTDFTQPGVPDWPGMRDWFNGVMTAVGADRDIFRNGLFHKFTAADRPDYMWQSFVDARTDLLQHPDREKLTGLVHQFDREQYNPAVTVLENLLYGTTNDDHMAASAMASSKDFLMRLVKHDLWHDAASAGMALARQVHALIGDIEADDPILDKFSVLDKPTLEAAIKLRDRIDESGGIMQLHPEDEALILQLFLAIIPAKHGDDLIDVAFADRLVALRKDLLAEPIPGSEEHIRYFNPDNYNDDLSIIENVLFGRLADMPSAKQDIVIDIVESALNRHQAKEFVMVIFGFGEVGIGGARLSVIAKQRIQLIRAIMKRPDILIMQEPLSVMTAEEQTQTLRNIRSLLPDMTIIWMDQAIPEGLESDQRLRLVDGRFTCDQPMEQDIIEDLSGGESVIRELMTQLEDDALFGPLPLASRRLLAASGEILDITAGDWLYHVGAEATDVYFIMDGAIQIGMIDTADNFVQQMRLVVGDTVGIPEIVAGTPRISHVRACAEEGNQVRLLRIDGDVFMDLMEEDSKMALRVIKRTGQRLAETKLQAAEQEPSHNVLPN